MKFHIRKIHSKITSAIFSLKQMKHLLDKKHLKLMASAYIKSHIEYCCNVFCLCTETIIKPITILLKKTIRIICNKPPGFHANTLFKQEGILPVPELISLNIFKFMHSYKQKLSPSTFNDTWNTNQAVSGYNTRGANNIHQEAFELHQFKKHPLFNFPKKWNDLPINLKNIICPNAFKKEVKKYLLDNLV